MNIVGGYFLMTIFFIRMGYRLFLYMRFVYLISRRTIRINNKISGWGGAVHKLSNAKIVFFCTPPSPGYSMDFAVIIVTLKYLKMLKYSPSEGDKTVSTTLL